MAATAVDLFCGAGGLTRGLLDAGVKVVAGYDIDEMCRFPYEHNNPGAKFHEESVSGLSGEARRLTSPAFLNPHVLAPQPKFIPLSYSIF